MAWLALRGVLANKLASLGLLVGLVVTALVGAGSAAVFTSTQAKIRGDIGQTWQTPFDLLVRPVGAVTPTELQHDLVRGNYAAAIHGGITTEQLRAIRAVPGVEVAAPLSWVGTVMWPSALQLPIPAGQLHGPVTTLRVQTSISQPSTGRRYDLATREIVVAPTGRLDLDTQTLTLARGGKVDCHYPRGCFAGTVCGPGGDPCAGGRWPDSAHAEFYLPLLQPVAIAGIDPIAEDEITGLGRCVTTGRLLDASDQPQPIPTSPNELGAMSLPALVSDHQFSDQRVEVAMSVAGRDVLRRDITMDTLYRDYLQGLPHYQDPWPIWSGDDVSFHVGAAGALTARTVLPRQQIFQRRNPTHEFGIPDGLLVPPETAEPWFRDVIVHRDVPAPFPGTGYAMKQWQPVGTYDPGCTHGFTALSGATLDGYQVPDVRSPAGSRIYPSRSVGDYVTTPPLVLTTLAGAQWLSDPRRFAGQPGKSFISVVRVRVRDVAAPGETARARLSDVAAEIQTATGLRVDVVKGASAREVSITLPDRRGSREVLERWSVKGLAISFTRSLDRLTRLMLGALITSALLLAAITSLASVRRRRKEFAVLRGLGWPRRRLCALVLVEAAVLGCSAAVVASVVTGIAAMTSRALVGGTVWAALLGLPLVVSMLAAAVPAWTASRTSASSVLRGTDRSRRSARVSSATITGLRQAFRSYRFELALAAFASAIPPMLIGAVLAAQLSFEEDLDGSLLGMRIAVRVGAGHWLLLGVTSALAVGSATHVMTLAFATRRRNVAVLRALGWSRGRALALALGGCLPVALGPTAAVLVVTVVTSHVGLNAAGAAQVAGLTGLLGALTLIVSAVPPVLLAGRVVPMMPDSA